MGKKGKKGAGKPVVMTTKEFFQSQSQTGPAQKQELKDEWGASPFDSSNQPNFQQESLKKDVSNIGASKTKSAPTNPVAKQEVSQKDQKNVQPQAQIQQPVQQQASNENMGTQPNNQSKQAVQEEKKVPPKHYQRRVTPAVPVNKNNTKHSQPNAQGMKQSQEVLESYQKYMEQQRKLQQQYQQQKQNSGNIGMAPNQGFMPMPQPVNSMMPQMHMPLQMPMPMAYGNPGFGQMNPYGQPFPAYIDTRPKKEPEIASYDQAMSLFEQKSKVEEQYQQYEQNEEEYGEEDYGQEGYQMDPQQMDPNQLASMFSSLALNANIQSQLNLDPSQLGLLQTLVQGFQHPQSEYVFETNDLDEDEFDDGEECVILTDDPVPKEIGTKRKQGGRMIDTIPSKALQEMEDDDDIIDYFLNNNEQFVTCEFFLKGNCRYADKCKYMHTKESKNDTNKNKNGQEIYVIDDECCICLEKVLANGKKFGVLDGCDHTFCLDCIRGWRSTYDRRTSKHHFRTCPICRRNSYLVVPSNKLVKSGPEKDDLMEDYKGVVSEIPCKHFNKGKGMCPFMNSCFYAHYLPDGTKYEYPWKSNKINEYGEWEDDDYEDTLADRIGNAL